MASIKTIQVVPSRCLFIILSACCLAAIVISGCDRTKAPDCRDTIGCVQIGRDESVQIGALQVLSGSLRNAGVMHVRAVELGMDHFGNKLLGHPIKLLVEDSECTVEAGTNAALSLTVKPQLIGIIGTFCSDAAIAASPLVSKAGLVMISGVNSAPSLTSFSGKPGSDWHIGYLRTAYNGKKMAELAAEFTVKFLNIKRAATISSGDVFTRDLTEAYTYRIRQLGGEIVRAVEINRGDSDMVPALTAIAYSRARLIYFPLFQPEAEAVIRQVRSVPGIERVELIGSGGAASQTFIRDVGSAGLGLYLTVPKQIQNRQLDRLVEKYKLHYHEAPFHFTFPFIYDASCLLLSAIESVAVQLTDGSLLIGRQALRDRLYQTSDFKGITGNLSSDQYGDLYAGGVAIVQLENLENGLDGLLQNIKYQTD